MDLQHRIPEALDEHLTVIRQLTALSSLILQVASELVATLRRQRKGSATQVMLLLSPDCRGK
jgi:hypothetical protein